MPAAKDSGSGVTTRAQDKGNDEQAALNHVRGKALSLLQACADEQNTQEQRERGKLHS